MPPTLEGATLDEAFSQPATEEQLKGIDVPTGIPETPEPETPSDEPKEEPKEETPKEPESEEVKEEEPKVPLSRFQKVYEDKRELQTRIADLERRATPLTDDEKFQLDEDKKLESKLDAILARREEEQRAKDNSDADELVDLMEVYGTFDVDKVLDIKDQYKVKDNQAAVKLYFKIYGTGAVPKGEKVEKTEKPKVPTPHSSAPITPPAPKVDISKTIQQLVEEGLREHGIRR